LKYVYFPRGSGKSNIMLERILDELKKGEKLIMLQDKGVYDINQELDRLRKERNVINNQIDKLEAEKNLKLADEYKGAYTYKREWKDRPIVRY
jgi:HD superfamily phosphohydrolase